MQVHPARSLAKSKSLRQRLEDSMLGRPDQPRQQVKADLASAGKLDSFSRQEILGAIDFASQRWQANPAGPERQAALANLAADKKRFEGSSAQAIGGLAQELASGAFGRDDQLKWMVRGGLAVGLAGFMGAMAGYGAAPLVIGLAGVATSAASELARQSQPQMESLGRLPVYAGLVVEQREMAARKQEQAEEVERLVNSLAHPSAANLEMSDEGVWIGNTYIPSLDS
ncbi:MAG: hypothetical protein KC910_11035 [Candidatus Eremiobacteraeota bacterium]|nr:hypothetical protein [Candidatus Eremiobacteraeota bacterium]